MKLTALFTALVLALTLSACAIEPAVPSESALQPSENQPVSTGGQASTDKKTASQTETLLTRDEAIAIALNDAGLDKSAIRDLDAERDYERGATVWEVDFDAGYLEYSYILDAQTGNILHRATEQD